MLGSEQGPKSMVMAEEVVASKCRWRASGKVFGGEEVESTPHQQNHKSVAACGSCSWCGRLEPHLPHLPFLSQLPVRSHVKFIFCLGSYCVQYLNPSVMLAIASTKVSARTKVCHPTSGGLDSQAWTPWKWGPVQSRVGICWQEKEEGGTSLCNVSIMNGVFGYECRHHLMDVWAWVRGCRSGGLLGMQREVRIELVMDINSFKSFQTSLGFVCWMFGFCLSGINFQSQPPLFSGSPLTTSPSPCHFVRRGVQTVRYGPRSALTCSGASPHSHLQASHHSSYYDTNQPGPMWAPLLMTNWPPRYALTFFPLQNWSDWYGTMVDVEMVLISTLTRRSGMSSPNLDMTCDTHTHEWRGMLLMVKVSMISASNPWH